MLVRSKVQLGSMSNWGPCLFMGVEVSFISGIGLGTVKFKIFFSFVNRASKVFEIKLLVFKVVLKTSFLVFSGLGLRVAFFLVSSRFFLPLICSRVKDFPLILTPLVWGILGGFWFPSGVG